MDIILLNVTQRHIDIGTRASNTTCPVALALKQKRSRRADLVNVDPDSIRIGNEKVILSSKDIKQFIKDFDNKRPVKPFTAILLTVKSKW